MSLSAYGFGLIVVVSVNSFVLHLKSLSCVAAVDGRIPTRAAAIEDADHVCSSWMQ